VAQSLLGYDFKGILTSDRYGAYNWLEVASRQVCWAHLKRDFIQIAERTGASAELGFARAAETPVCIVVSSPRWHFVSSRLDRRRCPDSRTGT